MARKCILVACLGAGIAVLVLWLSGMFEPEVIKPGRIVPTRPAAAPAVTVEAEATVVPVMYEAVGTVRPKTETMIEAQVSAKILDVKVSAGDQVKAGEVLIVLDNRELESRLEQAEQALRSSEAAERQAREGINEARAASVKATATWKRMKTLYERKVTTQDELDRAESEYLQAKARLARADDGLAAASAGVRRARKALEEAGINLEYATIKAQSDGEVARRMAEPGDVAFPGKTLMVLQTGGTLCLEAMVREGVISLVRPGSKLPVDIPALGQRTLGVVEEVVPSADPATRTFLVKVGLETIPGLYPGMFGRLMVPIRQREAIMVPERAVSRVGQLETVLVKAGESWEPVYVRTGPTRDGVTEILSGLWGNETLGLPDSGFEAPAAVDSTSEIDGGQQ